MKAKILLMILSFLKEVIFGKYNLVYYIKRRELLMILFTTIIVLFTMLMFSIHEAEREAQIIKANAQQQVESQKTKIEAQLTAEKETVSKAIDACQQNQLIDSIPSKTKPKAVKVKPKNVKKVKQWKPDDISVLIKKKGKPTKRPSSKQRVILKSETTTYVVE